MKTDSGLSKILRSAGVALMAFTAFLRAWGQPAADIPSQDQAPQAFIEGWPESARLTGQAMILKYGKPDQIDEASLVWHDRGPWKRIVVYREAVFQGEDDDKPKGFLQQTANYIVPAARLAALDPFTKELVGDPSREELSFRSDSESKNFLAINLADEIIRGQKTTEEAHAFYERQVRLMAAGKSSRYTERLLFPRGRRSAKPL